MQPTEIVLPAGSAKCGTDPCPQASSCARAMVRYSKGMPVKDFSAESGWQRGRCAFRLEPEKYRKAATHSQPTTHEPPDGILL